MIGPLWKDIRAADVATLVNVLMGILAIAMAIAGDTALAFHLVFAAVIVDGVDGALARIGGGGGPLGNVIDTLADVVTFVTAPAAVLMAHYGTTAPVIVAATLFAAAGVLRLARFQGMPGLPHFYGLSTPGAAIALGSGVLLGLPVLWTPVLALALAILMMSRLPVPKLRGAIGVAGVAIILANIALFLLPGDIGRYGLMAQLAFTAVYLVGGPFVLKASTGSAAPPTGEA